MIPPPSLIKYLVRQKIAAHTAVTARSVAFISDENAGCAPAF